jgi:hypothetical protein
MFHGKRYQYYWSNSPFKYSKYINNSEIDAILFKENFLPNIKNHCLEYYYAYSYKHDLKFLFEYDENQNIIKWDGFVITGWTLKPKYDFGDTITYCEDQYETLIDADCLAMITEWPEFRFPNFKIVKKLLNSPVIFDGRNIYDRVEMKRNGFDYFCIGIDTLK